MTWRVIGDGKIRDQKLLVVFFLESFAGISPATSVFTNITTTGNVMDKPSKRQNIRVPGNTPEPMHVSIHCASCKAAAVPNPDQNAAQIVLRLPNTDHDLPEINARSRDYEPQR